MSDDRKAVFLSYASQDAEAARRIAEALRAAGVEVWFDADGGLEHGDEWDTKIRRQIKECVLFIPIVSANTQARHEGYFRIEWELAAQRAMGIASGVPFILPVVIDGTREPDALVPDRFRAVQWTRLRNGEVPPEVLQRFLKLWSHRTGVLKHEQLEAGRPRPAERDEGIASPTRAEPSRLRGRMLPWLIAAAILAFLGAFGWKFLRHGAASAPLPEAVQQSASPTPGQFAAPQTEAQKLLVRVWALYEKQDDATGDDWNLADDLAARAVKLEPTNANAWAAYSQAALGAWVFGYDKTPAHFAEARRRADRAVGLAPGSFEARFALANCYRRQAPTRLEAEEMLRALVGEQPADKRVIRMLAMTLRDEGRPDEAITWLDRAAALPGGDPIAELGKFSVYWQSGRLDEAEATIAQILATHRTPTALLRQANLRLRLHGDIEGAAAALRDVPGSFLVKADGISDAYLLGRWRRDPNACLAALQLASGDMIEGLASPNGAVPTGLWRGDAYALAGDRDAAEKNWRDALVVVEGRAREHPGENTWILWRACLQARLGQRVEGLRSLRLYQQLVGADSSIMVKLVNSMQELPTLVLLGENDEALAGFEELITTAPRFRELVRYELEFDPVYDPLRATPRFQALLARLNESKPGVAPAPASTVGVAEAPEKPDPKSVVVLPFANLSGDPAQEYFSDGLTEEILNALAREPDLRVVPRTSAFSFKGKNLPLPEIARALNVAQVVEGSVQRAGNMVRIDCTLTRVSDGFAQPLPQFQREMKDASGIFAIEDDVAHAVVEKLTGRTAVNPSVRVATKNTDAYLEYLRGREALRRPVAEWTTAQAAFQRAVELDPEFAAAWAQLAMTALEMYRTVRINYADGLPLGRKAVAEALRLQPGLPEALLAKATLLRVTYAPAAEVERALDQATTGQPETYEALRFRAALLCYSTGRTETALALARRASEMDPLSGMMHNLLGILLMSAGHYAEADAAFAHAAELSGATVAQDNRLFCQLAWKGDIGAALRLMDAGSSRTRDDDYWLARGSIYYGGGDCAGALAAWKNCSPGRAAPLLYIAHAREIVGDREGARLTYEQGLTVAEKECHELADLPSPYATLALFYAGLGRKDEALAAANKALAIVQPAQYPREAAGEFSRLGGWNALARVEARFGMLDEALRIIEAQVKAGFWRKNYLRLNPDWADLQKDPRFQAIVAKAPL